MEKSSYTIDQGIEEFKIKFDFHKKTGTEKKYLQAVSIFRRYVCEEEKRNPRLSPQTLLDNMPDTIYSDFVVWLRNTYFDADYRSNVHHKPPTLPTTFTSYSESTVKLYSVAVKRMFYFWTERGYARKIDLGTLEKASGTNQTRRNNILPTRASQVPDDFGEKMIAAGEKRTESILKNGKSTRTARLDALRAECLIKVLCSTGLRASDLILLQVKPFQEMREKISRAGDFNEEVKARTLNVKMIKTGKTAGCFFPDSVLISIENYLHERGSDSPSPWLFIQHGRFGVSRKRDKTFSKTVKKTVKVEGIEIEKPVATRGFGSPLSTYAVWKIVNSVVKETEYNDPGNTFYVSTHALRHWFAQDMRDHNVPMEDVQAALGHANLETTIKIYAPNPNMNNIAAAINRREPRTKK